MPKTNLCKDKEDRQTEKIIRLIKSYDQEELGKKLGHSQQTMSYRIRKMYPQQIKEFLILLDSVDLMVTDKE